MSVTLDTGALISLEKGSPRLLALLDRISQRQRRVLIPAGVVAQAWRGPTQARLARLLRSRDVDVIALDEASARTVGVLLGKTRTTDIVDAHVVVVARRACSPVITSDPAGLRKLDSRLDIHVL